MAGTHNNAGKNKFLVVIDHMFSNRDPDIFHTSRITNDDYSTVNIELFSC